MELKINFHNSEIPSVDFKSKSPTSKVFEVLPKGGSRMRRQEVSVRYLTEIDYGIKGVTNNTDSYLSELYIDIPNTDIKLKKINRLLGKGEVEDNSDKYRTVIYDIAPGVILESLYITKGISERTITKEGITAEDISKIISNHLNNQILQRSGSNAITVNIGILIAIVEKYIVGYSLKWNPILNSFQIVKTGQSHVSYAEIDADDTFTFFRLLGLILDKGKHNGVFYIRAETYRSEVLEAMLKMIELLYRNQYVVFLYNADITCKRMEREIIEVPNYLII